MARLPKVRTVEEYAAGIERSKAIRGLVSEARITTTDLCYYAQTSYQSVATWLRQGLTPEQYTKLLSAIAAARAAQDQQEGR